MDCWRAGSWWRSGDGVGVVALAFHVDYWNRLGWTDRFSAPAFTDRQQRDAAAWKTDRVVIVQDERTRQVHGVAQARLAADAGAARVPFPADYRSFTVVRSANITQQARLGTTYANAKAASIKDLATLPYPNGSVIVMEWATPQQAADGSLLTVRRACGAKARSCAST